MSKHYRLIIMGYARHGKDTVSEMLRDNHHLNFISSSLFCAENIMFPLLKDKYGYKTVKECFDDRANHRAEWYDAIRDFNRPDPTRLGKAILSKYDIYCGIRHHTEFQALRNAGAFDMAIWVDRSDHVPPEPRSSCSVEPWMADFILDNNGSLDDLHRNLVSLYDNQVGRYVR